MAFDLTEASFSASQQTELKPNIVLEIEGLGIFFSTNSVKKKIKYGDGHLYGDPDLIYGGLLALTNQDEYISFESGTSTEIRQTLKQDKGKGESVSSLKLSLIDKNGEITTIISPGQTFAEIMGKRCKIWFGWSNTSFKDDYFIIHRGIIETVESRPGLISLNISHPSQKTRSTIFTPGSTQLDGAINDSVTTIVSDSTFNFLEKIVGPDTVTIDPDFRTYIQIENEVIEYQTLSSGTDFLTVTRGALGTTAASHTDDESISSFYRLGVNNALTLALKLMLSGKNDFSFTDIPITNFVRLSTSVTVDNSIFFYGINVKTEYNIQVGDFIETTGASNGANNVSPSTLIKVDGVIVDSDGNSHIIIAGVSFVEENDTSAVMKLRSKFDVWPSGAGFEMIPDEVDIDEHESIRGTFLPSFDMDFYLTDEVEGKDFLSEQIYNPTSSFSLPRKAQASMGTHSPPLPTESIKQLNIDNVINPTKLKITRSINKNLTNAIIYKFNESVLESGNFEKGNVTLNSTAIDRLKVGTKALVIESKGMREVNSATILATAAASRRLKKYAFGAEFISGIHVKLSLGNNIEIGDKILIDFTSLKISDIVSGTREGDSRIFEVINRKIGLRDGQVIVDCLDTNFDKDARFGLLAPSSKIKSSTNQKTFLIKSSFASRFGANEYLKWQAYIGANVQVVSPDYSTRSGTSIIQSVNFNTITLTTDLGFAPLADDLLLFDSYDSQTLDNVLTIFVHASDGFNNFADGKVFYGLI